MEKSEQALDLTDGLEVVFVIFITLVHGIKNLTYLRV